MVNIEEKIYDYLDISEEIMPIYIAPDFSDKIWYRRQYKTVTKYLYSLASICLLSLILWVPSQINKNNINYLVVQNQALEVRLAQVSFMNLTINQQKTMNNWYAELELIDQDIELQAGKVIDPNLWPNRARLLTLMIDFYLNPFEMYDI